LSFDQLFIGNSLYIEVTEASPVNPVSAPAQGLMMLMGTLVMLALRRRRMAVQAA